MRNLKDLLEYDFKESVCYNENKDYNQFFIHSQNDMLMRRLKYDGYLLLGDAISQFGLARTAPSLILGWKYENGMPDNIIDLDTTAEADYETIIFTSTGLQNIASHYPMYDEFEKIAREGD